VADDSSGMTAPGANYILSLFDAAQPLHKYFETVVDGIELAESWNNDAAKIDVLGAGLKARGFTVGHHTMPIRSAADYGNCRSAWCDLAMLQLGNPFQRMSKDKARKIVVDAAAALAAKVVAFEYDIELNGADLGAADYACGGSGSPAVTQPEQPAASGGAYVWSYGGEDFSRGVRDESVIVSLISASGSKIKYDITGVDGWTKFWGDCNNIVCGFNMSQGGRGGKIEWGRPTSRDRDLKNWTEYKGWVEPNPGDTIELRWYSIDGAKCSNAVRFVYNGRFWTRLLARIGGAS
jgi:hypothetical protein